VGVVGSGTMGAGIAQVAAQSGLNVLMYDIEETALERAINSITHFITRAAEKGQISKDEAAKATGRLRTTTQLKELEHADFVIEAVPEILNLKQDIFGRLDDITDSDIVLATNTSTLSVTQIAAATARPEQVVGMHFFNPAPLMPLVEVIAGSESALEAVNITLNLARQLGKEPVRASDTPGFIVNRVARSFYLEALRLLEQGVTDFETIDRLIKAGGGFAMGPFELMDLIGVDTNYHASKQVYDAYFQEPRFRPSIRQQRMMESGRLGRKTGRGWYDYREEV
jgi:3-hydroxybutyryl-CoA dehydrogenase